MGGLWLDSTKNVKNKKQNQHLVYGFSALAVLGLIVYEFPAKKQVEVHKYKGVNDFLELSKVETIDRTKKEIQSTAQSTTKYELYKTTEKTKPSKTETKLPHPINYFENHENSTIEEIHAQRISLYKKECKEYLKTVPHRLKLKEDFDVAGIWEEIAKGLTSLETFMERRKLGTASIDSLNHDARSLCSMHTVDTFKKLGKDVLYCAPEKTGISTMHKTMSLAVTMDVEDLFGGNSTLLRDKGNAIADLYHQPNLEQHYFKCESLNPLSCEQSRVSRQFKKWNENIFNSTSKQVLKIVNARHPFARLASAHRDKHNTRTSTSNPNYFWWYRQFLVNNSLENNQTLSTKQVGDKVSFWAFLKGCAYYPAEMYNKHWSPGITICEPCLLDYNIVSKTETMDDDIEYIQSQWNPNLKIPGFGVYGSSSYEGSRASSLHFRKSSLINYKHFEESLLKIYENIPLSLILKLVEVYEWDFRLFGYDYTPFIEQAQKRHELGLDLTE